MDKGGFETQLCLARYCQLLAETCIQAQDADTAKVHAKLGLSFVDRVGEQAIFRDMICNIVRR